MEKEIKINQEKINKWFASYVGLCQKVFGIKDGKIDFPSYGCETELIYNEIKDLVK